MSGDDTAWEVVKRSARESVAMYFAPMRHWWFWVVVIGGATAMTVWRYWR